MTGTPAQAPSLVRNMRMILSVMGPRRRLQLAATFTLMLIGAFAELVTIGAVLPLLAFAAGSDYARRFPALRQIPDAIGVEPGGNLIIPAAIILIIAAAGSAVIRLLLTWITQKFVYGLQFDLELAIYGRILRQPYQAFVRQNSSTAISGLERIYNVVVGVISSGLIGITSAGMALFIIAFLFLIDPVTASIAAVTLGTLYVAISLSIRRIILHISERTAIIRTARIKLLQESLGGMRDIILDHSEDVFERKLAGYEFEMRRLQVWSNVAATAPRFVVEGAGIILVALLSVYFSMQPGGVLASLPILGALALGAQRLLPLLQGIYSAWTNYSVHAHSIQDVVALLQIPINPARNLPRPETIVPFGQSIALRSVTFSYGGAASALAGVDLTIEKGERIGLVGKTGSGKSTLVDVLMGLLHPTKGDMLLDGEVVDDSNIGNWQAQIAHVPQAIFLSDDSIAANIAFGADDRVDMERVWEAARRADLGAFIEQLPHKMDTEVGERGVRLSGGQRQRIGIARALYKRATVLILDEATSALDDQTEQAVMHAVTSLGRDLTIIMIAHRLSTVAGCDTIYRLDGGHIVQSGSYEEVVLKTGRKRSG